jgi:GAF domain-containing protein
LSARRSWPCEDTRGTPWTEAEQALVAAVAERLAMTADGIRLLDDVQRRAARDRLLAETASRLRESLELETVLKSAANEIRQALDLGQVVVRLQPSDRHSRESGSPEPADRHSRAIGNPGRE